MPKPSPFHERTVQECKSLYWKDWSGYHCVDSYDTYPEREYFAFRHAVGMIDVTPLFKYDVWGPDAEKLLSRVMVKDISKLKLGQITYTCWCDDDGWVMDDGTVWHMEENFYRVTAAEPTYHWLHKFTRGLDVNIKEISEELAALAVQGPNSRELLKQISDIDLDELKFFRMAKGQVGGRDAVVTRTGYTGDLGFEVWVKNADAINLWDSLRASGKRYGLEPCGMAAMDVTRVEAGFIMNGVDYTSANHCMIEARKSTPYEIGLGWTVNLNRAPFNGQAALIKEKKNGSRWDFVGIDVDWDETEALFNRYDLPPEICTHAWRTSIPVYDDTGDVQVGYATSGAWSPLLKKNLALVTIKPEYGKPGTEVKFEITAEHTRHKIKATVGPTMAYNPARKRS